MNINFTKMHGLGNDFVVIDAINQPVSLNREQIRQIADRHFGIGCDQLLLVEAAQDESVLFTYRIFNADGNEVEQCGNGARCFARFVYDKGLTQEHHIPVQTNAGKLILELQDDGQVTVNMGTPEFRPEKIPFDAPEQASRYGLALNNETIDVGVVALGNPHAVFQVSDVTTVPLETLGPQIEGHDRFPQRVNAGFMQIIDQNMIKLRVYERGVGETLACGSGACAAVVVGRLWQLLSENVHVQLPGGTLSIAWSGEGQPVMMTGPAQTVFDGSIDV
jgi:diaminopimelate epimerase